METFNISRFWNTFLLTVRESRSVCISVNVSFFIAYVLLTCFNVFGNGFDSFVVTAQNAEDAVEILAAKESLFNVIAYVYLSMYVIYLGLGGCYMFINMRGKSGRTSFMMLPATNLEKYLARYVYASLFWAIMGLIAICASDLVRMLIFYIVKQNTLGSMIPYFFNNLFDVGRAFIGEKDVPEFTFALLVNMFWYHTFTVLTGTMFQRHPVVFSWLSSFVLTAVVFCVFFGSLGYWNWFEDVTDEEGLKLLIRQWSWIAIAVFSFFIIVNYCLSYWIFRRMQAVNNKWMNL